MSNLCEKYYHYVITTCMLLLFLFFSFSLYRLRNLERRSYVIHPRVDLTEFTDNNFQSVFDILNKIKKKNNFLYFDYVQRVEVIKRLRVIRFFVLTNNNEVNYEMLKDAFGGYVHRDDLCIHAFSAGEGMRQEQRCKVTIDEL